MKSLKLEHLNTRVHNTYLRTNTNTQTYMHKYVFMDNSRKLVIGNSQSDQTVDIWIYVYKYVCIRVYVCKTNDFVNK